MEQQIRLLILEHDVNDIDLLKYELKKSLNTYSVKIVQTEKEFTSALASETPDIILSDYSLPNFDGVSAFYLKQKLAADVPFMIVSGTIGEENAIELIKNGVTDYVLKDKLYSLAPKMKRALNEAKAKREKAATEIALHNSEASLRAMFDNTDIGFLLLNTYFDVLAFNSTSSRWASSSFGVELKKHINFRSLIRPQAVDAFDSLMNNILAGNDISYETSYPKKEGMLVWFQINIKPVKDQEGSIIGICIAVNDITQRKNAEDEVRKLNEELEERVKQRTEELLDANRSLEAFSYSVSHDLRSPLRSIMGFAQIIKRQYSSDLPSGMDELFNHILSSTERMNAIIEDLLALAKYGKQKLNLAEVDMNSLFNRVWGNICQTISHRAVIDLFDLPRIRADVSMVEQVVINLLSNAVKYSSKVEQPVICVGFEETHEYVTYFVKDNGAGFDMQHYNKLFGAFQRLHATNEFEGTGVGLLLVKRIIEKHGGTVWAEGKVNEGATFWFSLPKE